MNDSISEMTRLFIGDYKYRVSKPNRLVCFEMSREEKGLFGKAFGWVQKLGTSRNSGTYKYERLKEEEPPRREKGYDIAGNNDPKSMLLPRKHK